MTTSSEPQVSESNPFDVLAETLEAAAAAFGEASADPRATAAKFQSGVGKGAYYTTYGLSYGVVFTGVFLKELLPAESSLRRGLEQGATAGAKAATGAVARFHLPEGALAEGQAPAGATQR